MSSLMQTIYFTYTPAPSLISSLLPHNGLLTVIWRQSDHVSKQRNKDQTKEEEMEAVGDNTTLSAEL